MYDCIDVYEFRTLGKTLVELHLINYTVEFLKYDHAIIPQNLLKTIASFPNLETLGICTGSCPLSTTDFHFLL